MAYRHQEKQEQFLGLASYYRVFVPMFFQGTALLAQLTKTTVHGEQKASARWQQAFHVLQETLCSTGSESIQVY